MYKCKRNVTKGHSLGIAQTSAVRQWSQHSVVIVEQQAYVCVQTKEVGYWRCTR